MADILAEAPQGLKDQILSAIKGLIDSTEFGTTRELPIGGDTVKIIREDLRSAEIIVNSGDLNANFTVGLTGEHTCELLLINGGDTRQIDDIDTFSEGSDSIITGHMQTLLGVLNAALTKIQAEKASAAEPQAKETRTAIDKAIPPAEKS